MLNMQLLGSANIQKAPSICFGKSIPAKLCPALVVLDDSLQSAGSLHAGNTESMTSANSFAATSQECCLAQSMAPFDILAISRCSPDRQLTIVSARAMVSPKGTRS